MMNKPTLTLLILTTLAPAQVTPERASSQPRNWLTYHGSYKSQHHTALAQITPANVSQLDLKWVWQAQSLEKLQPTPLVVDGVMYVTQPPSTAVALDAATGRAFWMYEHKMPAGITPCCGRVNRGLAISGTTLFMATLDAHLIALDAATGRKKWDVTVAEYKNG